MKKSLFALGLLSLATIAQAQHSTGGITIGTPSSIDSTPLEGTASSSASTATSQQKSTAAWALYNVTGDALDLANDYRDNPGIGNTTAGTYLAELAADTRPLRTAAGKLAALLEKDAPQKEIDAQLKIIADRYADVRSGNQKASTQLYIQAFPNEGTLIRNAYVKVRSRWVYLQGLLD